MPGHPLNYDFEAGPPDGWWGLQRFVETPKGSPSGAVLTTRTARRPRNVVMSAPFLIDFDELSFRFKTTGQKGVFVQLLVQGRPVLAIDGAGISNEEFEEVRWPVHSWHGRVGTLRFVDGSNSAYLMVDNVRSSVY